jgi:tRNA nucleotidyltransferase (CCA-adding enzyme)
MSTERWEHFAHDADIGVRGIGGSKEAAFVQAALALTAVITDPQSVEPRQCVAIKCEAPDDELLLVDWLNALIYEMATRRMLFSMFEVQFDDHRLCGFARGEPVDVVHHAPAVEIKGATMTCLHVGETSGGMWIAECVVDV